LLSLAAVALFSSVVLIGTGGATAQETNNSSQIVERIDDNTVILDKGYNPDTGEGWVDVRSDVSQRITVSDGGALFQGKEIDQHSVRFEPGEENRLTVTYTEVDGRIALAMATRGTNHGILIETSDELIGGPWSATDAQLAALGAGLSTGVVVLIIVWRVVRGRDGDARRVA
jgi:hypothetical protein